VIEDNILVIEGHIHGTEKGQHLDQEIIGKRKYASKKIEDVTDATTVATWHAAAASNSTKYKKKTVKLQY